MKTERDANVMFFHGKTIDGYRFTIASTVLGNNTLSIGLSICSKNDRFTKEIGRNISLGRCLSQRTLTDIRGRKYFNIPSNVERVSAFFYEIASECCNDRKKDLIFVFNLTKSKELPF